MIASSVQSSVSSSVCAWPEHAPPQPPSTNAGKSINDYHTVLGLTGMLTGAGDSGHFFVQTLSVVTTLCYLYQWGCIMGRLGCMRLPFD